ncbi:YeiH family protein [Acholeplasma granularum]|uniref:YeiH family protein n=1 Tax=Acholeplasma granularum TaxID=264635 RepID=UPI0004B366A7|nr:putative sulfate exporter family transporter [Acholeplasma granularum]
MITKIRKIMPGILLSFTIAVFAILINNILPIDLIGAALISLLLGMLLNPIISKKAQFQKGIDWSGKYILRLGIILAGISLSFAQVLEGGKYALILLTFTFITAFGVGVICKNIFKIDWKLSSLLSVSTAICGGTAVATVGPVIEAEDHKIAYALSATFIFDLLTVILFPWIGMLLGMSDTTYGLWVGTSVNDTSSVVAAGYAFSEAAGSLATIVKLTRTLFIVPIVLFFSWFYAKKKQKNSDILETNKIKLTAIFPWFILGFIAFVGIRSLNILSDSSVNIISTTSKFFMATALGAIGLKTSFNEVKGVGAKPVAAAIIIDISVVIVSMIVLYFMF